MSASATAGTLTMSESFEGLIAEESEEGSRHMQALITAGRELATHLPLNKLFDLILDLSVEAAGAARGVLMTLEDGELQVRSTKGPGPAHQLARARPGDSGEALAAGARRHDGRGAGRPRQHRAEPDPQHDGRAAANRGPRDRADLSGFLALRQRVHQAGSQSAHGDGEHGGGAHRKRPPGRGGSRPSGCGRANWSTPP